MIKIPHSIQNLEAMALDFYQKIEFNFQLENRLQNYTSYVDTDFLPYFEPSIQELKCKLKDLIIAQPPSLEILIVELEKIISDDALNYINAGKTVLNSNGNGYRKLTDKQKRVIKLFKIEISKIFNYDFDENSFGKINNGALAYDHADNLSMNTCPYCNSNYTFTIRSGIKCRPQFDHFLSKSKYPYLALSFFNLIPSCSLCNSGALKGQKPFLFSSHIHPFLEDINDIYRFRTNIKTADFVVDKKSFEIDFEIIPNCNPQKLARAKNNIKVLGLAERYKVHKNIAGEAIKLSYVYSDSFKSLYESFGDGNSKIFESISEIKILIKSSFLHADNFHLRALSKLSKDIAEEFGLFD